MCFISLIILVCLEVMVRLWGYSEMYLYDPIYMPYAKSPEIPFVLKPNLANSLAHGNILINTDELGLRSLTSGARIPPKGPKEYRLAFLGDSVTFGVGVATADTYPEVVQATLNRLQNRCPVKVFNFAVSSYSVKEMAATLQYRVPEVSPNLVVMGLIINDFDTARTPGIDALGYNTHGGASEFINRYTGIKFLLRKIHLSYLLRDILSRIMQQKRVEVELMQGKMPDWIAESYGYVIDFKKLAQADGYQYLVVTLPTYGGDGSQFREIIRSFQRDKIDYCDISTIAPAFSAQEYRASRYDSHPSALVHRQIGERLSEYIEEKYLSQACP
ncbi:MAG: SGNH/GDSL hydrolase family protein [Deltaproteobacteria bacterium]|nr:SGNH/GDSL hydrolase family protein [Deltaproteobacteria bacterium]